MNDFITCKLQVPSNGMWKFWNKISQQRSVMSDRNSLCPRGFLQNGKHWIFRKHFVVIQDGPRRLISHWFCAFRTWEGIVDKKSNFRIVEGFSLITKNRRHWKRLKFGFLKFFSVTLVFLDRLSWKPSTLHVSFKSPSRRGKTFLVKDSPLEGGKSDDSVLWYQKIRLPESLSETLA